MGFLEIISVGIVVAQLSLVVFLLCCFYITVWTIYKIFKKHIYKP